MGQLAREIQQGKRLTVHSEVFLNAIRTADALIRGESNLLKPHGLTSAQYNVLRILRGAGPDGLRCADVSERLVTRDPDVTRLLDRLEAAGLVSRARNDRDRRVITAALTSAGAALLAELDDPIDQLHRTQLGHMPQATLRQLSALLEEARRTVE